MLIIFQARNNIITHTLLTTCCRKPLNYYRHQIINNFEKLLKEKNAKNILKVVIPIFLTISIHIEPTRFLKVGFLNIKYNSKKKLYERYTSVNWHDKYEIEKVIAVNNNKNNDEKIF